MASDEPPRFVLFLPPVPSPPSISSLKAAFGDTVSQVLKEVASHSPDSSKASVLEIALSCPELVGHDRTPRSSLYHAAQGALAGIYKLVCVIAARYNINIEDADGVDVRVLLVAWSPDGNETSALSSAPYGPIIGLEALAHSGRQWQYAFGVESEAGEAMVKAFVAAKGSGASITRVQSGPVMNTASSQDSTAKQASGTGPHHAQAQAGQRHHHVAVGGTFDHLHIGHKLLLSMTVFAVDEPTSSSEGASSERSATIGITGDQLLLKKKYAEVLESWDERQQAVQTFVDSLVNFSSETPHATSRNDPGPNGKSMDFRYSNGLVIKCVEIQDPFGPTITEEAISALIISAETRSGGKAVNDKRKESGWEELEVFEVDVLDAGDGEGGGGVQEGFESKLSSTAIREKIAKKMGVGEKL
ncbi:hypothetical protein LTR36_002884 [Oleoguttula mirabilis]|uniref:Cytidyltransferase-like domain-containing protein n=1 Tax=Oleoguttula mirabilis TaxID=1507867 RepID=A0AAV9JJE8_9PEZI|nr:hypothetical protein LTR36_002884 [Oleoguttula mirabilis]